MSRSSALRGQILDSARRLFSVQGFRATSLQDIASDVGCSKASLLYHFPNKEAILLELVTPAWDYLQAILAELAPLEGERLVRAAVTGFVDLALRFRREIGILMRDVAGTAGNPSVNLSLDVRLLDALAGRSADPYDRVAARMVLGGIVLSASRDDLPVSDEDLRQGLLRGALRTLGYPD